MALGILVTLTTVLSLRAPFGYGFPGRIEESTGHLPSTLRPSAAHGAFRRNETWLPVADEEEHDGISSSNRVDQPALPAGGHLGRMGNVFPLPTQSRFDLRFVGFPSYKSNLADLHPTVVPVTEHINGILKRSLHSSGTDWSMEHAFPNGIRPSSSLAISLNSAPSDTYRRRKRGHRPHDHF